MKLLENDSIPIDKNTKKTTRSTFQTTTKNEKDDAKYLTDLLFELQQLDLLISANQNRYNIFSNNQDENSKKKSNLCPQSLLKNAREILLREILITKRRVERNLMYCNNENSFPKRLCTNCSSKFGTMKNCSNSSDILFEEFKKLTTFTLPKNIDESIVKNQNECEVNECSSHVNCLKKMESFSSNVNNKSVPFGTIIEKIAANGNCSMLCKILFPENFDTNYNMIGRILGPRGISIRQMESKFSCKILIRGKGSIKNVGDEERLRLTTAGKHLEEKLHVLIAVEKPNRDECFKKINAAKTFIEKLLMKPEFDDFKRNQLIQLAIINGTYRSNRNKNLSS